ncbi:MAG: hypothetical protein HY318_14925 [Armatimonadetes bacterium]|nr:hypothetical protein [Armatimonadota bacterium]
MKTSKPYHVIFLIAPVLLALVCLTISLKGFSVYGGFDEREPGTHLSLMLMTVCGIVAILAAGNRGLCPSGRRMAGAIGLVVLVAVLDEYFSGHEALGKYLLRHNHLIPGKWMQYDDDVMILLGGFIGSFAFYRIVRSVRHDSLQWQILGCVVLTALVHGSLDLLSHNECVWSLIWPSVKFADLRSFLDQLSCFEEWNKIWCEWFVLCFLLRQYYTVEIPVIWSLQVLVGSVLATPGLWYVNPKTGSIPYVVLAPTSEGVIRNFHLLGVVACVWLTWTWLAWRLHEGDIAKIKKAGWFWLCPVALVLSLNYSPFVWLVAVLVGYACIVKYREQGRVFGVSIVLATYMAFSAMIWAVHPDLKPFLLTCGLLLPCIWVSLTRSCPRFLLPIAILAAATILMPDPPTFAVLLLAASLAVWMLNVPEPPNRYRAGIAAALGFAHILFVMFLILMNLPELLPNEDYEPTHLTRFSVGFQGTHGRLPE